MKPEVNVAAAFIGMAVGTKKKNRQVAQATTKVLKNITGGTFISLTDMHGNGLCLEVI